MAHCQTISITGYKSIKQLENFKLRSLNVLIGANGAGKSNFIGFFKLINQIYKQDLQLYVQKQGGPDALLHFGRAVSEGISTELSFGNNAYKFKLIPTNDNVLIFKEEISQFFEDDLFTQDKVLLGSAHSESKLPEATDNYSPYVRNAIKSWQVYHFHDTSDTAKVKQKHASNDNLILKFDAANLAPYLLMLHQKHNPYYQRIVDTIRLIAPYFDNFLQRENSEYVELEWLQKRHLDTPLKAHMLSDGTLRFICLATLLLQPPELLPDTILIDEPELGLHPYAIHILAGIFKQVAAEKQLIIATQSVELINELDAEDIIVVDQIDGASTFKRLNQEELSGWLEEYSLGELWTRNIFGGRP